MPFDIEILFSFIALVISLVTLCLYILDIRPRLKVGFYIDEQIVSYDDIYGSGFTEKYYLIDIVNHSSRRIKVANVSIEWMKSRWLNRRKRKGNYPDFNKTETNKSISSLWIEPWGDKNFVATEEDFNEWLFAKTTQKALWIRVIVTDVLGKKYYSNRIKIY